MVASKTMRSSGMISVNRPSIGYSTPSGAHIVRRKIPPGRKSSWQPCVVSGAGVNQRERYSALVQASNTSCLGASKTRVMRSSGGRPADGSIRELLVSTALLLFEVHQEVIQAVAPM